jgi:hypothetical protein
MSMSDYKPKVLVDFDGPIHMYRHGWMDGTAYDSPSLYAKASLEKMEEEGYEVVIFSSRDPEQIVEWLAKNGFPPYRVTNIKEPAVCQIDDRAIRWITWMEAMEQLVTLYPIKKDPPPPLTPEQLRMMEKKLCPTCQGYSRETTDMVCQTCGRDYMKDNPRPTRMF